MTPRPLLHLEGAAVFILSLFAYHWNHGSWLQFAVLFLVPDVSMIGYLANTRIGAITYNASTHILVPLPWPVILSRPFATPCCCSLLSGSLTSVSTACLDTD